MPPFLSKVEVIAYGVFSHLAQNNARKTKFNSPNISKIGDFSIKFSKLRIADI